MWIDVWSRISCSSHLRLPFLDVNLIPADHDEALALIDEYSDIFSTGPHDFLPIKCTSNHLNLEDNQIFRAHSYQKTKVKDAQVAVELKNLLDAGLLQPSKSPGPLLFSF